MLHRKLSNGTEVAIKETHFSRMVAIQCWVGAGSIHEQPDEYGMAHVLEHMLFKGTEAHGVGEISRLVESYGGDINAFTTFDHTVFYLTLTTEHWRKGLELLADAVFNSAFDEDELTREKEVILEEIRQGLDNPGNQLGRKVFEELYQGSPAARPIIGTVESVSGFDRDKVKGFHQRWYQPNNMKVVVTGDVDTAEIYEAIKSLFGKVEGQAPHVEIPLNCSHPSTIPVHLIEGEYAQPRIEIAYPGPAMEHPDHVDLDLAAFALGAGDSSRLTRKLRDEQGVASSVGCSLYSPKFGGIFGVSAIPEPSKILECISSLAEQLGRLKAVEPVTSRELSRAITNLRADQLYQEETVNGQARSLGFSLSTSHKTQYDVVYEAKVLHASSDSVTNAINGWLKRDQAVLVAIVPKGMTLAEENVRQAYIKGFTSGTGDLKEAAPSAVVNSVSKKLGPTILDIKPGLKLVYRRHAGPSLFNLVAVTEGGLRADGSNPGIQNCFANLLTCASKSASYEEIIEEIESNGAVMAGFSGKDSLGIKLQCFSDHVHHMAKIWRDCLLHPVFPERQWEITKLEIQDDMRSEQDSPASLAVRRFQERVFGDHPYRYPLYGSWDSVSAMTPSALVSDFQSFRDQGPWVVGAVGDLPEEEVEDLVRELFDSWEPQAGRRSLYPAKDFEVVSEHAKIEADKEQTHIVYGGAGLSWDDPDRCALDVLSTILGGSGGRFFVNLRDKESLAYTVTPMLTYGRHKGAFGAYMACAPRKVDQALQELRREFMTIGKELSSADEIDRAKNYLIGSHESEMQRGDAQAMTMALMEAYGLGYNDFLLYSDRVRSVKAEDVMRVATRLLDPDRLTMVTVGRQ
ncbi:M16 family metallopeptidase [Pseudobacteriovorax antillogorgiicola]|uniref:Zinc protease n=1 Tax=Pseudobacteriovorax antillogorgiicola TaxID=1513793 RepID=A0A1Y6B902_9BACT|nr:pitrilysin family protein [Pseudobacteriovorax antillogorgiicola]TCS59182.1 zinc protease [Pseudobacteriovorax antillogorgiicola]SME90839.1 zinc protease [Pseudobacteriovorax antillogorgiicola]